MDAGYQILRPRFDDDEGLHDDLPCEQSQHKTDGRAECTAPASGGADAGRPGLRDIQTHAASLRYVRIGVGKLDLMQHAQHRQLFGLRQVLQKAHDC